MNKLPLFLATLILTSCMPMEYDMLYTKVTIKPVMKPDGTKIFSVIASDKLPSYAKNMALEDFHKGQISAEMGKLNYCTNGYAVDYKNAKKISGAVFYEGTCK